MKFGSVANACEVQIIREKVVIVMHELIWLTRITWSHVYTSHMVAV